MHEHKYNHADLATLHNQQIQDRERGRHLTEMTQNKHQKNRYSHVLCVVLHCAANVLRHGDVCTRGNRAQARFADGAMREQASRRPEREQLGLV